MGVYLNPGPELFRRGRNSKIYVDKSDLLVYLNGVINTESAFVCVSRPRRFGKSMAANMVCTYYGREIDGASEFAGMKVAEDASFDAERNRYDVIRLNMQQFLSATHDMGKLLAKINQDVSFDIRLGYRDLLFRNTDSLPDMMADAFAQTGTQFVIVIDEWDCVIREMRDDPAAQDLYLDFLRAWLKDQPYVALAYMTGILPIKKYGTHSALNMFSEFSMTDARELAPTMGFTDAEVRALCDAWEMPYEETNHLTYNDENALAYTLSLGLYVARQWYSVTRELPAGKGFADLVLVPRRAFADRPAIVVELKWDRDTETAITQIHEKRYPDALAPWIADGGAVVLASVSYDKKTRAHSCAIERLG